MADVAVDHCFGIRFDRSKELAIAYRRFGFSDLRRKDGQPWTSPRPLPMIRYKNCNIYIYIAFIHCHLILLACKKRDNIDDDILAHGLNGNSILDLKNFLWQALRG